MHAETEAEREGGGRLSGREEEPEEHVSDMGDGPSDDDARLDAMSTTSARPRRVSDEQRLGGADPKKDCCPSVPGVDGADSAAGLEVVGQPNERDQPGAGSPAPARQNLRGSASVSDEATDDGTDPEDPRFFLPRRERRGVSAERYVDRLR